MWPSLVHFMNFPKDKQMYLIPLVASGTGFEGQGHQVLIIATVSGDKLGTLCMYDPIEGKDLKSHHNLKAVRDVMAYCKVGGAETWSIKEEKYFRAPRQKGYYCVIACACFALDFAGHEDFAGLALKGNVSCKEYAQYKKLIGGIGSDFPEA
jgi:hypothetical protein